MRKLIGAATLAALGVALLPIPASASFDHHFTVLEKVSFQPFSNETAFRFRGKLFDPRNREHRVGRDSGLCKVRPHNTLRCRGTYHLNGVIGGFGDIEVQGDLQPDVGDNRLSVVGGSGDFNGVAGRFVFEFLNRLGTKSLDHFALVR
jgi:hypothetical protein